MMRWENIGGGYVGLIERLRVSSPREILGVSEDASLEDIKAAYRKKIRAYHPDRTDEFMRAHGEEVSKLLNSAYRELTNSGSKT